MNTVARGSASSPPSRVLPVTPTMVRQSPLMGLNLSNSPVQAIRFPTGSSPGKNSSANVLLTITTSPEPGWSVLVNSRPRSSGMPEARKYSGLAVRTSACGTASPTAEALPSALTSNAIIEVASGMLEPNPASVTPGRARISLRMRSYCCLAAASSSRRCLNHAIGSEPPLGPPLSWSSGTSSANTSSARRPLSTSDSRTIVRVSSPAPASSTTDTAT